MSSRPIWVSLLVAMALSACSSSTPQDSSSNKNAVTQLEASKSFDDAQIHIYISSAESQLLMLEQQNTKHCIAGQLSIAHSFLAQASNEHKAKMNKDAFITLVELDRQIRKIRCINQYINGHLGCSYTDKKTVLKRWYSEGEFNQCIKPSTPIPTTTASTASKQPKDIFITETLYDFDQDNIKPIYYQSLNNLVQLMKRYPQSRLLIRGHTDSKGSNSYNMQLSKKRTNSVANYFTERGIAASHIVMENKGEESIREVEQSDVSRVFNRHTSITLFLGRRDNKAI